jgi:DNA-directed RNA polymerase specialized sigma24 family protein
MDNMNLPGFGTAPCNTLGVRWRLAVGDTDQSAMKPFGQPTATGEWTFQTTSWSAVLRAGDALAEGSREALEGLCRVYWFPLYAFVRRKGYPEEDAKDLTQAFFSRLLEKHGLSHAASDKGRFRTFLLCSMQNFLNNEWDRARALKRGGAVPAISLEGIDPETRYRLEPVETLTPDRLFDRRWAQETMSQALARLRAEFDGLGKSQRFDALKGFLVGGGDFGSYAAAAEALGVTEQAIKGAVLRLRRRLGELLRQQIAETVTDEAMIEQELRHLLEALCD